MSAKKSGSAIRLFVASSSENLPVTRALCRVLRRKRRLRVVAEPWNKRTFALGEATIESLENELDEAQFAVMILTPDDVACIRHKRYAVPRDNVLFELGLFMGRLGRGRCYMLYESDRELKRPTDLLGVKAATYPKGSVRSLEKSLGPACDAILDRMSEVLDRPGQASFAERIIGTWWEEITTRKGIEISFFRILPGEKPGSVRMDGDHFDGAGNYIGHWYSTAVDLDEKGYQLVYGWEGSHPAFAEKRDAQKVRGFGTMAFHHSDADFHQGEGEFIDIVLNRLETAQKKFMRLRREVREKYVRPMRSTSDRRRKTAVSRIREEWA